MFKAIATFIVMLCFAGAALAQPRLNGPLFPALPDTLIEAMSDAVSGCPAKLQALLGQPSSENDKAVCSSLPIPIAERRIIVEAGRVTGLLEACGVASPSREVLPQAMRFVEALPGYNADMEMAASTLHGFARGFFRNAFVQGGLCQSGDPGEKTHYVALGREHLATYVLPAAK